jgi:hypothetical protein
MRIFIVLLLLILLSTMGLAQDTTGTIVILSDKIGPTIDLEERDFYKMFMSIRNFESAVLMQRPDGSYTFKVIVKKESELSGTIRWFPMTEDEIEFIRHSIEPDGKTSPEAPPSPGPNTSVNVGTFGSTSPEIRQSSGPTPNINISRISGEFAAGGVFGFLLSYVFAGIGYKTIGLQDEEDSGMLGAFVGFFAGAAVGSSFGVYIIGNIGNQTGSYGATLLGSTLGIGISLITLSDPDDSAFWIKLYTLPALGGIMGFNASRRYKTMPASGSAIINLKDGRMDLAVPIIYFRPSPFDRRMLIQNIDLVRLYL